MLGDRELDGDTLAAETAISKVTVLAELQLLTGTGAVRRAGSGHRGDPFTFKRAGGFVNA